MHFFGEDAIVFSKTFFDPENMKKNRPQKLLIIGPQLFLCTGLAAQMAKKQKSRTTKRPLMQDWVFRLGSLCNMQIVRASKIAAQKLFL